jgi:hypothetical protein
VFVQLECDSSMVEELRGPLEPAAGVPRRGTTLVMTTQVSVICFGLLSYVVKDGDVLCRVCLFVFRGLFVWWCMLLPIMYQCCFFLHDIAVLLL